MCNKASQDRQQASWTRFTRPCWQALNALTTLSTKESKLMKKCTPLIFCLVLSGCMATTSGSKPQIGFSGFDNAKTVSINPHGNDCRTIVCTGLGAQWNSSSPDSAILIVNVFNDYAAIVDAELNIDGRRITLLPIKGVTDISNTGGNIKESSRGFIVSTDVIASILTAKRVWLRVHTPTGYIEDAVIDGEKDSKAFHALSRFMQAIQG